MIFVFVEDGTLEVIEDLEEARRRYEGIDVESGVFRFYDENGCFLAPKFAKPTGGESCLAWFPGANPVSSHWCPNRMPTRRGSG